MVRDVAAIHFSILRVEGASLSYDLFLSVLIQVLARAFGWRDACHAGVPSDGVPSIVDEGVTGPAGAVSSALGLLSPVPPQATATERAANSVVRTISAAASNRLPEQSPQDVACAVGAGVGGQSPFNQFVTACRPSVNSPPPRRC